MATAAQLLAPISGSNPSGERLRNTPIYDKIKLAREQDDGLPAGAWETERKVADYGVEK
jgi:type VI secretion system protein ImpA